MMRAAIDVGSNTVRMLLAKRTDQSLIPLRYERKITRLGGGFSARQGLAAAARLRTLTALQEFAEQLDRYPLQSLRVVGTEVIRKATNQLEFLAEIHRQTGLRLEVLSDSDEARLSALGVFSALQPVPDQALVFDLGGGSLELALFRNRILVWQCSRPLGVVTLVEQHPSPAARRQAIDRHMEEVSGQLIRDAVLELACSQATRLVGTAGTVTTLAAILQGLVVYQRELIENSCISRQQLDDLLLDLEGKTLEQLRRVPGLEPGREDLIVPGIEILLGIFELTRQTTLIACDSGLLEGLLLER